MPKQLPKQSKSELRKQYEAMLAGMRVRLDAKKPHLAERLSARYDSIVYGAEPLHDVMRELSTSEYSDLFDFNRKLLPIFNLEEDLNRMFVFSCFNYYRSIYTGDAKKKLEDSLTNYKRQVINEMRGQLFTRILNDAGFFHPHESKQQTINRWITLHNFFCLPSFEMSIMREVFGAAVSETTYEEIAVLTSLMSVRTPESASKARSRSRPRAGSKSKLVEIYKHDVRPLVADVGASSTTGTTQSSQSQSSDDVRKRYEAEIESKLQIFYKRQQQFLATNYTTTDIAQSLLSTPAYKEGAKETAQTLVQYEDRLKDLLLRALNPFIQAQQQIKSTTHASMTDVSSSTGPIIMPTNTELPLINDTDVLDYLSIRGMMGHQTERLFIHKTWWDNFLHTQPHTEAQLVSYFTNTISASALASLRVQLHLFLAHTFPSLQKPADVIFNGYMASLSHLEERPQAAKASASSEPSSQHNPHSSSGTGKNVSFAAAGHDKTPVTVPLTSRQHQLHSPGSHIAVTQVAKHGGLRKQGSVSQLIAFFSGGAKEDAIIPQDAQESSLNNALPLPVQSSSRDVIAQSTRRLSTSSESTVPFSLRRTSTPLTSPRPSIVPPLSFSAPSMSAAPQLIAPSAEVTVSSYCYCLSLEITHGKAKLVVTDSQDMHSAAEQSSSKSLLSPRLSRAKPKLTNYTLEALLGGYKQYCGVYGGSSCQDQLLENLTGFLAASKACELMNTEAVKFQIKDEDIARVFMQMSDELAEYIQIQSSSRLQGVLLSPSVRRRHVAKPSEVSSVLSTLFGHANDINRFAGATPPPQNALKSAGDSIVVSEQPSDSLPSSSDKKITVSPRAM